MELMVTIAIAGILLGVAIPSFTSIISSNRLTTYTNELVTALNLARSEAIKRGVQVTVRKVDAKSCTKTGTNWKDGWDVFVDINGNETCDDATPSTPCATGQDCLLRTYDALPSGYTITTGNSAYKDYAAYLPSGLSNVVIGDTFILCNGSGLGMPQRTITINSTGRPSVDATPGNCP